MIVGCILAAAGAPLPSRGAVNVTQHHNHDSRNGLYVDPAFTTVAAFGLQRDQRFDGTIQGNVYAQPVVFSGGGVNELMAGTRRFNTGIAARGRIYVANDNKVYAFTLPAPAILLTDPTVQPGGYFQFTFTNVAGKSFTAFGTTNLSVPLTNWNRLGAVPELTPGQFQFRDPQVTNNVRGFYRVTSP